jgi:hypothetical protein
MMFGFEPTKPKAGIQQVAAIEETAPQEEQNTPVAKDQLTLAEREAEQNSGDGTNLAVRSLQEALELYPGHLPAREMLVKVFEKGGKNGEAMYLLADGLQIAPDYIVFKKTSARLL